MLDAARIVAAADAGVALDSAVPRAAVADAARIFVGNVVPVVAAASIRSGRSDAPLAWDLHTYETVGSTNIEVKNALAAGCPEGYAAAALEQTAGYGRQGRLWKSPVGGLYLSFALRPACESTSAEPEQLPTIGPVMGYAVAQAMRSLAPEADIRLKWPNDVMLGDAKLVGISAEHLPEGGVCIGIGTNVLVPEGLGTRQMGRYKAAYLSEHIPAGGGASLADQVKPGTSAADELFERVCAALLASVATVYAEWNDAGFAPFVERIQGNLYGVGERIALEHIDGSVFIEGTIEGIDEHARLLIRDSAGVIRTATSGEFHTCS